MEMTAELRNLTWITLITALMWVPYVLDRFRVLGIWGTLDNPPEKEELALWAMRMKRAHYNAVENLVIFAALVLVAHAAGLHDSTTVLVTAIYLWARVVHFVAFTAGLPVVRTLGFLTGWGCQVALAVKLLF